jgi:ATP-dependent DNA helicase 2 subunit 1
MHKPLPDEVNEAGVVRGKSMLHQALKAIVDIERRKVLTGPSDSIGVLLYNVDVSYDVD